MDEHGEKVAEAAAKHGMTPQEWCDSQAPLFKDLWRELEISNDDFIRTTEERQYHAGAVPLGPHEGVRLPLQGLL
jgi:methionyl-tRNA synthetase